MPDFEGDAFANLEELSRSGYNLLIRGQRYGKFFALKALAPEHKDDYYYQQLLRKEFDLSLGMNHPNIIRVYSLENVEPYGLCIVMEYVNGRTLDEYLKESPTKGSRRHVAEQILDAMSYYHSQQIVHRDIKPSNVLVTTNGDNVRIIDFGLSDADYYAVLKEPAFSKQYASPEQLRQEELDCRTDIYSFGLMLREMFPHSYRRMARRCCRPLREQRYASAEAVRKALFSPWKSILAIVVAILTAAAVWAGCYASKHVNTEPFDIVAPSGQTLQCRIVESEAHILGGSKPEGLLVIPHEVRHGLRRYPVAAIDSNAFRFELGITGLSLPEGLEALGASAFQECSNLTDTLILPESLEFVERGAFCGTHVTHVVLRSRNLCSDKEDLYRNLFLSCKHLQQLTIAPTVEKLFPALLSGSHIASIVTPDNWTEIPYAAFSAVEGLQHLHLSPRIKSIGISAFWATSTSHIVLPDSVESMQGYTFRWAQCRYLEMGSQMRYIGSDALANMERLDTLVIRAPYPPECNNYPFEGTNVGHIVLMVPPQSKDRYKADANFSSFNIVSIE